MGCWPNCERIWREQNTQRTILNVGDLSAGASCSEIDIRIQKIQNEINAVNGRIAAGDKASRWKPSLEALENKMRDAKNAKSEKKCQELLEKQQKEQETAETLKVLEQTTKSATTVDEQQALMEKIADAKGKKADYTKYIAIGIAGIFVVAAVVILLKPKKK